MHQNTTRVSGTERFRSDVVTVIDLELRVLGLVGRVVSEIIIIVYFTVQYTFKLKVFRCLIENVYLHKKS